MSQDSTNEQNEQLAYEPSLPEDKKKSITN